MRQIYPASAREQELDLPALYAYPVEPRPGGQPWIRANMVASADGAATVSGRSGGLAGEADHTVFGLLRALADVVLVGAATARAEGYRPARVAGRWAGLRGGRPPAPPIAVLTRSAHLDPASPLLAEAPAGARTIVLTGQAAPADRRAALARVADVVIAGRDRVDMPTAIAALAGMGHRRILTEGGPHLLGQLAEAGLLDELCLTISPLLAGGEAGRITRGAGPLEEGAPGNGAPAGAGGLCLGHVLEDQGYLLCRYLTRPG